MRTETNLSKFLSYVLRHKPIAIGLEMDEGGWVEVDQLILKINSSKNEIVLDLDKLTTIVENDKKQRYTFSLDKTKIRANQGHSVLVDLGYAQTSPPEYLYHGTPVFNIESIKMNGLQRKSRHHVHLSKNRKTALAVGRRHGKPVVLVIHAGKMYRDGYHFYCSTNHVWLTSEVPARYIEFPKSPI